MPRGVPEERRSGQHRGGSLKSRESVVTRLQAGQLRDFSLLQSFQTSSGVHPLIHWVGGTLFFLGQDGRGRKPTMKLHLVLRLRVSGAVPVLPHMPS